MDYIFPKIFGIGLSKTGITSLTEALRILGYSAIQAHTSRAIHDHEAATDTPVAARFQELDRMYPNSKFIMTIRDKQDWIKSCKQHFGNGEDLLKYKKEVAVEYAFCRGRLYGSLEFNEEVWLKAYANHTMHVYDYFNDRPNDILWMYITEGWQALCHFLEKPIPQHPFPYLNKSI